ncbi:sigma-70 family RNA polymerase sigma factor [Pseudomonas putida]|uniref:sigma-70 family RNA polymerase sigma factor n=1 Tax=Pseudomonas putida TaxID=303 RepID=UPI001F0F361A|nr:sigma-70 family RNA polymerase sigma factor [Pseudomonas putida]
MRSFDHPAIVELYSSHHSWLRRWLSQRINCPETAADLAPDTFLRVLSKSMSPHIEQPRAYLRTIAYGLFVNHVQRKQLEQNYLHAISQLTPEQVPSPLMRLQILQTLMEIDTLLSALPHKVRSAFLLFQLDGLKHSEIAQRLGVSVSSVRQYIARALLHCLTAA